MATLTDEELVKEYLAGDETALRSLIERYLKPIYNFVYRYVGDEGSAEDITQDTFVKAWKHLKEFDQERKFKTWIFTIAKNTALNWIKKKKPALLSEFENWEGENELSESITDPSPLPEKLFERSELSVILSSALNELNPNHRAVLLMHYKDDFTFQEISESLEKPLHTVKSQHRRALIKLRTILTPTPNEDKIPSKLSVKY